jgi:hypothetical protein
MADQMMKTSMDEGNREDLVKEEETFDSFAFSACPYKPPCMMS